MTEEAEDTEEYTVTDFVRALQIDFEGAASPAEAVRRIGADHREVLKLCDPSYRKKFEELVTSLFNLHAAGTDPLADAPPMTNAVAVFEDDAYWNAMADIVRGQIYEGMEQFFMDELEQAWNTPPPSKPTLQ